MSLCTLRVACTKSETANLKWSTGNGSTTWIDGCTGATLRWVSASSSTVVLKLCRCRRLTSQPASHFVYFVPFIHLAIRSIPFTFHILHERQLKAPVVQLHRTRCARWKTKHSFRMIIINRNTFVCQHKPYPCACECVKTNASIFWTQHKYILPTTGTAGRVNS